MWSLFRKEVNGFFSSLTAYVVMVVFLLANSAFIWLFESPLNVLSAGYASLDSLFSLAPWIFLFLVPAISMRMISEERRSGTLDLLYTRPVSELQIIAGKFLAAWFLIFLSLLPTLVWFWSVSRLGSPAGNIDGGGTWGSYIGLLFLGGIYASIGIFSSSLSSNQIVSFVLAVALSFLMFRGFDFLGAGAGNGRISVLLSNMGIEAHYRSVSRGVVDSRDLVYFAGMILFFLMAARMVLLSRNPRPGLYLEPAAVLVLALLLGLLSSKVFYRVDLTSEKRYTLADSSRDKLRNLEAPVLVRIYLDGELPAEFEHFRKSVRELMEECAAWAGPMLRYEFENLYDEENEELRNRRIGELYDRGLKVTSVQMKDREGGASSKIIFPGAMVSYGDYSLAVNFLKNNPALSHEQNLNNSLQTLEYEFMRALHSLTLEEIPKVAFIEGHGELDSLQTHSLMDELKNFYQVDRGRIQGNLEALLDYRALIIARPTRSFSEADKFALDQYIMHGGKVLFFLDPVNPFADSLTGGTTVALASPVGLEDLLFRYGIRVQYNLVADLRCSPVPVNMASSAEQARFELMPWVYYPLLSGPPRSDHPVTRGLNYCRGSFVSSLDTLEGSGERVHSVLLASSDQSRIREVPLYISMEEITLQPDPALFNASALPVAVLTEGIFTSFYRNYPVPGGVNTGGRQVLSSSRETSILVVGDGDLCANEVHFDQGQYRALPLGYDPYTRQTFGNLEFIMNALNQMTDELGIMDLRSREFRLRLLNREITGNPVRVLRWKLLNALLPVALVLLGGLLFSMYRKRKYAS